MREKEKAMREIQRKKGKKDSENKKGRDEK